MGMVKMPIYPGAFSGFGIGGAEMDVCVVDLDSVDRNLKCMVHSQCTNGLL